MNGNHVNNGSETSRPDFFSLPIEAVAFEALSAIDDEVFVEVYRLLIKLGQRDAAALLAIFVRRIADVDVTE